VAHLHHHAAAQLLVAAVQAEAEDVDNNKESPKNIILEIANGTVSRLMQPHFC
jgi:hypothetical protein